MVKQNSEKNTALKKKKPRRKKKNKHELQTNVKRALRGYCSMRNACAQKIHVLYKLEARKESPEIEQFEVRRAYELFQSWARFAEKYKLARQKLVAFERKELQGNGDVVEDDFDTELEVSIKFDQIDPPKKVAIDFANSPRSRVVF